MIWKYRKPATRELVTIIALARPSISFMTSFSKMRSITSDLYWIRPSSWNATFFSALATTPAGYSFSSPGFGTIAQMQVVESLVRNDVGSHVDNIAFGDGLGFGVSVERLAE